MNIPQRHQAYIKGIAVMTASVATLFVQRLVVDQGSTLSVIVMACFFVGIASLTDEFGGQWLLDRSFIRRRLYREDYVEGLWIDASLHPDTGQREAYARITIKYKNGQYLIDGESFAPNGDVRITFKSQSAHYRAETTTLAYAYERFPSNTIGFQLMDFTRGTPPQKYRSSGVETVSGVQRHMLGIKVSDDENYEMDEAEIKQRVEALYGLLEQERKLITPANTSNSHVEGAAGIERS